MAGFNRGGYGLLTPSTQRHDRRSSSHASSPFVPASFNHLGHHHQPLPSPSAIDAPRPDSSDQSQNTAYFETEPFLDHPFNDGSSFVLGKELYKDVERHLDCDLREAISQKSQPQPTSTTYDSSRLDYTYIDVQRSYTQRRNMDHAHDLSGLDAANVSSFQNLSDVLGNTSNSGGLIDPLSKSCPVSYVTQGAVNEDIKWRGSMSSIRLDSYPSSSHSSTPRRYGKLEHDGHNPQLCLGTAQADLDSSLTEEVQRFSNDADSTVLDAPTVGRDTAQTPIEVSSRPKRLPRLQPRPPQTQLDGSPQCLRQESSGNVITGPYIRGSLQPYQYPTPPSISSRPFPQPGSNDNHSPNTPSAFQSTSSSTILNTAGAAITQASNTSPQSVSGRTQCEHCPQSFTGTNASRMRSLRRHMSRNHPAGPPREYQCVLCDVIISRSDLRVRHLKRMHGIDFPTTPRSRRRESWVENLLEGSFRRIVL